MPATPKAARASAGLRNANCANDSPPGRTVPTRTDWRPNLTTSPFPSPAFRASTWSIDTSPAAGRKANRTRASIGRSADTSSAIRYTDCWPFGDSKLIFRASTGVTSATPGSVASGLSWLVWITETEWNGSMVPCWTTQTWPGSSVIVWPDRLKPRYSASTISISKMARATPPTETTNRPFSAKRLRRAIGTIYPPSRRRDESEHRIPPAAQQRPEGEAQGAIRPQRRPVYDFR